MKYRYEVYHGPFPFQPVYFKTFTEASKFIKEQIDNGNGVKSVEKVDWTDIIEWGKGKRGLFDD